MPRLRLGLHRLPTVEIVVIQSVIRLSAHNRSCPWKLVGVPPFDALVVDGASVEDHMAQVEQMAPVVLTVTREHSDGLANTLERPIRPEKLQQWLSKTARELIEARRRTRPADSGAALSKELLESARFKLGRWPPVTLMGRHEENDRMANLLWQRQFSVRELADCCGQPLSRCEGFLQALSSAGVLNVHAGESAGSESDLPKTLQRDGESNELPRDFFDRLLCRIAGRSS